ncbi:MAG: PAS domain S-box protein, partial [Smithella sp.]|nr:PAS domain S-box protein [Smithella sp.]
MKNPLPRNVNKTLLIALAIFISASAVTILSGYYIYQYQKKEIGRSASQQLTAIAELKVWEISNWRNERLGDANVIYKNDAFAENVEKYFNNPLSHELKNDVLSLLAATQNSYQYQNILLIDKNKTTRLAIHKYDPDFGIHHADIINNAFDANDIIISDIHRDERDNSTHISVVIPIVIIKKSRSITIGTVIILLDPQHRLYPTIKKWPMPSETGEALLVHRDGNEVVFLNELRHIKNIPLMLRYPITQTSLPAVRAVLGLKGAIEGIDYRKKKVFAAVKAVPDTTWFLVTKIDQEEIFSSLATRFWLTVFFILVTISIMGILIAYVWRYQQAKYYREKYELEDKRASLYARSLIEASLDPLVTISPEGKIMDVNESTEFVTGRSRKELIGSNFSNYFTEPEKADEGYKLVFEKGMVR